MNLLSLCSLPKSLIGCPNLLSNGMPDNHNKMEGKRGEALLSMLVHFYVQYLLSLWVGKWAIFVLDRQWTKLEMEAAVSTLAHKI